MLKDILEEKGLTAYKVSSDTGIPYTTLNDILLEKTDITKTSAETLHRLSTYLNLSMEYLYNKGQEKTKYLYLYNEDRNVILEYGDSRFQYLGPKNLLAFKRLNCMTGHVLNVECYFTDANHCIYEEEDYVDLADVMGVSPAGIAASNILIGKPDASSQSRLIDCAFLVSDDFAILPYHRQGVPDLCVEIVCLKNTVKRAILRVKDYAIVESTMSKRMQDKAARILRKNYAIIADDVERSRHYA